MTNFACKFVSLYIRLYIGNADKWKGSVEISWLFFFDCFRSTSSPLDCSKWIGLSRPIQTYPDICKFYAILTPPPSCRQFFAIISLQFDQFLTLPPKNAKVLNAKLILSKKVNFYHKIKKKDVFWLYFLEIWNLFSNLAKLFACC